MTSENLYRAIGDIDDTVIWEAKTYRPHKKTAWIGLSAIAACFALVVGVWNFFASDVGGIHCSVGGIDRVYRDTALIMDSSGILWRWEDRTIWEQYTVLQFEGREYRTRAREINVHMLDKVLGTGTAQGYDSYEDQIYTADFTVYSIRGVPARHLVAVDLDGSYYVYISGNEIMPQTFGTFLDLYNLSEYLSLTRFTEYEDYESKGTYILERDDHIWKLLSECREAKPHEDKESWIFEKRNEIKFTITSDPLGIYKKEFSVTQDGFVSTNIMEYHYIYFIGEENANAIISYVKQNAAAAESLPYKYTLSGTLTEIGEGYILVDDTVLCTNPRDGMVFKVLTEDIRIGRCLSYGTVAVGDIVMVSFSSSVGTDADNTIDSADSICKAILADDKVLISE